MHKGGSYPGPAQGTNGPDDKGKGTVHKPAQLPKRK